MILQNGNKRNGHFPLKVMGSSQGLGGLQSCLHVAKVFPIYASSEGAAVYLQSAAWYWLWHTGR